jgi:hypothetical protein
MRLKKDSKHGWLMSLEPVERDIIINAMNYILSGAPLEDSQIKSIIGVNRQEGFKLLDDQLLDAEEPIKINEQGIEIIVGTLDGICDENILWESEFNTIVGADRVNTIALREKLKHLYQTV